MTRGSRGVNIETR